MRPVLPFVAALVAISMGNDPQIALMGEAVWLMKDSAEKRVRLEDWPPLETLLAKVRACGVPIFV